MFADLKGLLCGSGDDDETENIQPDRSSSWDFTENENPVHSPDDTASEVMEFFEMAANLIRTLAPDSTAKAPPAVPPTAT